MKYIVQVWTLDSYPEIEIDQPKFDELRQAQKCLSGALAIEEKYELLLSNYLDLEKECLNLTADYMVRSDRGYSGFFDLRLAFNRRIVNLLTSTKLYVDQIQNNVKACIPDNQNIATKVKSLLSAEYDACFEYRFMEALRNHVQHCGLAVHSTSVDQKLIPLEGDFESEYKTRIFTHKLEINNNKFKTQVFNEMPEKVELMYATRVYIESISKVHYDVRQLLTQKSEESRQLIDRQIKDYKKISNGESIGLHAVCFIPKESTDEVIEKFPLILDWDNIRIRLINKNEQLVNLRKRFVSGSAYNRAVAY
jgi:hypothetical protein